MRRAAHVPKGAWVGSPQGEFGPGMAGRGKGLNGARQGSLSGDPMSSNHQPAYRQRYRSTSTRDRAQEAALRAARELAAQGVHPSGAAVARRLGWTTPVAHKYISPLRAAGRWPWPHEPTMAMTGHATPPPQPAAAGPINRKDYAWYRHAYPHHRQLFRRSS